MSEKSAPAEGVENTTEDQTGEVKQTLGAAGIHDESQLAQPKKPQHRGDAGNGDNP